MSANKYANLPDIDTAPDVYETEDVFPSSQVNKGDSSDDEQGLPTRRGGKNADPSPSKEEVDTSNLMNPEQASKKFRKAERRRELHRGRTHYAYPPSPASSDVPDSPSHDAPPLSYRLRMLQNELAALEVELADPSNPLLHRENEPGYVDPGELIRGLVDVKGRLEKITKAKEGRARLVNVVMDEDADPGPATVERIVKTSEEKKPADGRGIAELDSRVGELEAVVGSSSTTLDELSPLPPPLLPLLTRLNTQLTVLTQPRHIDSISRRLKLLLSDLDRVHQQQQQQQQQNLSSANPQRRQSAQQQTLSPAANATTIQVIPASTTPTALSEQLASLLTRLGPTLPHIPHLLTRLRTLSALHISATEFQNTLEELEAEQKRTRELLLELSKALEGVEKSLDENRGVVKGNVGALEGRVEGLLKRIDDVSAKGE